MTTKSKILCVDDDLNILKACNRLLYRAGFDVTTTDDPDEALQLVQTESFSVVLSDQLMPLVEGTELLEQIRTLSPDTVRILLTGYADLNASIDAINRGEVFRYLTKPWDDKELIAVVSQAVINYDLSVEILRLQELTTRQNAELTRLNEELEERVARRTKEVARLATELEETLVGTSEVLGALADKHSPTLGNHGRRVATLSMELGKFLELDDDILIQLRFASALHDIGKINVSQEILTRTRSAQTEFEKELLDQHAIHGEELIAAIPNMEIAALFVRHHHERFDGSGFPERLSGEAIPLGARIIAVANTFDNLMNSRVDFQESSHDNALAAIREKSNSLFDPAVVEALAACLSTSDSDKPASDSDVDMNPADLTEGMVLARDLKSSRGLLLLAAGTALTKESIEFIQRFRRESFGGVFVERRKGNSVDATLAAAMVDEELQPA